MIKKGLRQTLCVMVVFYGSFVPSMYAGNVSATVQIGPAGKSISPDLFGIFFEDINYAADGGLYAELVQNRSFEYNAVEQLAWNAFTGWEMTRRGGGDGSVAIDDALPLHPNNPKYVVLDVGNPGDGVGLVNAGFDGIAVKGGERYDFSVFSRQLYMGGRWTGGRLGRPMPLEIRLETPDGRLLASAALEVSGRQWKRVATVLTPSETEDKARLVLLAEAQGGIAMDVISLFPQKTFRDRENGLRADLAQTIADLKPKFIRFPGGCLVHGNGLGNMYRWKDTIGPIQQRKEQPNLWGYHQTGGLGYFEYFQFCEDIGAKPLPVVPAAVSCQNSGHTSGVGQQAIPMEQMPAYIQDVLDLIEWANGPAASQWGKKRAEAGHPEPFHLKYLGLGNEDVISPEFKVRYKMINDAIKARYPEIIVIGTTGPATDGRDYEDGWEFAGAEKLPMVDEHGYKSPTWFWENLQRFDDYQRTGTNVYLGEYAAHDSNRANTLRSALAEAAYMTSLERNGDLVRLSSYAPLLSKQGRTQWRPDMIYFDNVSVTPSVNYYAQQLFSQNFGDTYLPTTVKMNDSIDGVNDKTISGVLLGTWDTQAKFEDLKVTSDAAVILKDAFSNDRNQWNPMTGRWTLSEGAYIQNSGQMPALSMVTFDGSADYTITLRAMKTAGSEGFLVGFGAIDTANYYWWNLGGWGNTEHRIEKTANGSRTGLGRPVPGSIETGRWYDIKIQVTGRRIQCYLDGKLIHDITDNGFIKTPDLAASTVRNTADGTVILKLVSKASSPIHATLDLSAVGPFQSKATRTVLTGEPLAENRFGQTPQVLPQTSPIDVDRTFVYDVPPHSLTVICLRSASR